MLDPFRSLAPEPVRATAERLGDAFHLPALPLHAHEVLFSISFYAFIGSVISPMLSSRVFPRIYPRFSAGGKINWDIHVVSIVQSSLISALGLYVLFCDDERASWTPDENWHLRIWGYSGMTGLLQSMALGYFIWDLYMCVRYVNLSGVGMVIHALASSSMFTLGYRPLVHFYCPIFLMYDLSTPFLNVHWFCDKLDLTGSTIQAVNGAFLVSVFFGCRLVYGTYGAISVSRDVYRAATIGYSALDSAQDKIRQPLANLEDPHGQTISFLQAQKLPLWLAFIYVAANVALTLLNVVWFSKMIETVRKRFDPPFGTKTAKDGGRAKKA